VLVIDPNEHVGDLVAHALRSNGYLVAKAARRSHVLTGGDSDRADLVILDPTASSWEHGLRLCREIRARQHVPVVLVTSHCLPEEVDEALAAGAADVVCKPFSPSALVARVGAVLGNRRTSRP
jgi:DNA-binding response OmpR family regulator